MDHHSLPYVWKGYLIILVYFVSLTSTQDTPGPPTNLRHICPNIDCTVFWDPPEGSSDNEVIYYSAIYQSHFTRSFYPDEWTDKTECTNSTANVCNFGADFTYISDRWYVQVTAYSERYKLPSSSSEVLIHPFYDAIPGPPDVYQLESTSRTITISWYPGETPYTNEDGSAKRLDDFYRDEYNMTYWNVEEPANTTKLDLSTKRTVVLEELNGIKPWTVYKIIIQCRIQSQRYGPIPANLTVQTKEEAPGEGVTVNPVDYITDCTYMSSRDLRQVKITWLPINEDYWYGNLTHHKVDYWIDGHNDTKETMVTDATATSIVLVNLSRWKAYNIVVQVCNSAGCSPHKYYPYPLPSHSVVLSPPTNTSAYATSYTSFNVTWNPPNSDECIESYHVEYVSGDTREEVGPVDGLYAHIGDVTSNVYHVYVYADITAGNDSTVKSMPGKDDVTIEAQSQWYIIVAVAAAILVFIMCCLVYRFRKLLHVNFCYMVSKEELQRQVTKNMETKPVIPQNKDDYEYDPLLTSDTSSSDSLREAIEIGIDISKSVGSGVENPTVIIDPSQNVDLGVENPEIASSTTDSTQTQSSGNTPNGYIGKENERQRPSSTESYSQLVRHTSNSEHTDQEIDEIQLDSDDECSGNPVDDFISKIETHENPSLSDILDFDNMKDIPDSRNFSSDVKQPNNVQLNEKSSQPLADTLEIDVSIFLKPMEDDSIDVDQTDAECDENLQERPLSVCSHGTTNSCEDGSACEQSDSLESGSGYENQRNFAPNVDTDGFLDHSMGQANVDSQDVEQHSMPDYTNVVSRPLNSSYSTASSSIPSYVKVNDENNNGDNTGSYASNSVFDDMEDVDGGECIELADMLSNLIPVPADISSERNTNNSSQVESTFDKPVQLKGMEAKVLQPSIETGDYNLLPNSGTTPNIETGDDSVPGNTPIMPNTETDGISPNTAVPNIEISDYSVPGNIPIKSIEADGVPPNTAVPNIETGNYSVPGSTPMIQPHTTVPSIETSDYSVPKNIAITPDTETDNLSVQPNTALLCIETDDSTSYSLPTNTAVLNIERDDSSLSLNLTAIPCPTDCNSDSDNQASDDEHQLTSEHTQQSPIGDIASDYLSSRNVTIINNSAEHCGDFKSTENCDTDV
ncbi:uncharacterized protein LOC144436371 isoform X2 [Glandiceps talaboti]